MELDACDVHHVLNVHLHTNCEILSDCVWPLTQKPWQFVSRKMCDLLLSSSIRHWEDIWWWQVHTGRVGVCRQMSSGVTQCWSPLLAYTVFVHGLTTHHIMSTVDCFIFVCINFHVFFCVSGISLKLKIHYLWMISLYQNYVKIIFSRFWFSWLWGIREISENKNTAKLYVYLTLWAQNTQMENVIC